MTPWGVSGPIGLNAPLAKSIVPNRKPFSTYTNDRRLPKQRKRITQERAEGFVGRTWLNIDRAG